MIRTRNKKGFTLMETMIYIALFGIIMSGAVVGTYNLLEGGKRNTDSAKVEEEGTFLNRKINWALSGASHASVSGGGKILTITRPDLGAQSPIVIAEQDGKMTITRGTASPLDLNTERFQVSNTNFMVEEKTFNFRNYLRQ